MLQSFSLGNFLSFKDVQTLDMVPEGLKEQKENLHIPYLYNHQERLLKSVAIYGHNSHGKSNFIKGFQFFQSLLFNSFSAGQQKNTIETEPFLMNENMLTKPTYFEICFIVRETKYRYAVTLNEKGIIEEELHYAEYRIRENYLFKRKGQEILVSKNWNKENANKVEQVIFFTKPHILFLSALLSQEKISRVNEISTWLNSTLIIPDDYMIELTKARSIYSNPEYKPLILKFIKKADIGFTTIFDKIEDFSKHRPHIERGLINMWYDKEMRDFELFTKHDVFNDDKEFVRNVELGLLKSESAGSVKYFIIVSLLAFAIKNSQLVLIDELDAKFHSILLEMLVESFHSPDINPMNSQMVFTTHNTILLDKKLRRDQMVVIEKNEWGESSIKRMHTSKKPIRVGKSVEKEYQKGTYGGVSPNLINPELFD